MNSMSVFGSSVTSSGTWVWCLSGSRFYCADGHAYFDNEPMLFYSCGSVV